jgi:hypothetical protein
MFLFRSFYIGRDSRASIFCWLAHLHALPLRRPRGCEAYARVWLPDGPRLTDARLYPRLGLPNGPNRRAPPLSSVRPRSRRGGVRCSPELKTSVCLELAGWPIGRYMLPQNAAFGRRSFPGAMPVPRKVGGCT